MSADAYNRAYPPQQQPPPQQPVAPAPPVQVQPPPQVDIAGQIKQAFHDARDQFYSKEALTQHSCSGEGCGVCAMRDDAFRAGMVGGAKLAAKFPDIDWSVVE